MKKLVSVILLVLCAAVATAQTAVTLSGGDNEFFINTTAYPVNSVALNFNDDSTYLGIIALPNSPKVTLRPISYYKRVGGVSFADADAIIAFADSFMFSSGGGGSGTVTSVTSGNLSPIFTSSVSNATTTPAISYSLSNAAAYTVLTNSTNATVAPSYQKVHPLALYSTSGTANSSSFYRGDGQWAAAGGGDLSQTQSGVSLAWTNFHPSLVTSDSGNVIFDINNDGAISNQAFYLSENNARIALTTSDGWSQVNINGGVAGTSEIYMQSGNGRNYFDLYDGGYDVTLNNKQITLSDTAAQTTSIGFDSTKLTFDNTTNTITTSGRLDQGIYYTQISLTSAQILTLNSVPVELVPAPGAGKYIVPIHMSIDYTFVSAAYSGSTLQTYEMADKSGPITSNTSFLNFASSTIRQLYLTGAAGGGTATYADNQPLMMWVFGSNPTTGDGTAKINVYYKIVTR